MIRSIMKVSRICAWNIVNVHYVDPHLLRVFKLFLFIEKKLVLSYWGSDLMRDDNLIEKLVSKFDGSDICPHNRRMVEKLRYMKHCEISWKSY